MPKQFQLFFVQRFKGRVLFNEPMSEYTSLKIGGPAEVMAFPEDEADLKDLLAFAASKRFPVFLLGAGTNLLVRDGGLRGIVVNLRECFKEIEWKDGAKVVAGAGVLTAELARKCAVKGLSGLEFAVGIPGTFGGAVSMNAGAYGGEVGEVVDGVEIVTAKGKKAFVPKGEIGFGYRKSDLPVGSVVVRVHLSLKSEEAARVKNRTEEVKAKRAESVKISLPNAGSVFKNPEGESAGRLIEEAGLKGECSGGAQISEEHANYIVNTGSATARDVLALMATARDSVFATKGIVLEPELRVIGED